MLPASPMAPPNGATGAPLFERPVSRCKSPAVCVQQQAAAVHAGSSTQQQQQQAGSAKSDGPFAKQQPEQDDYNYIK